MNLKYTTDDYENKKIFEESLHPEGIRKTVRVKDEDLMASFKRFNAQKIVRPKRLNKDCDHVGNAKKQIELISTIVFIIFFFFFIMFIFI